MVSRKGYQSRLDSPSLVLSALSRHAGKGLAHVCDRDFITLQCLKCGHRLRVRSGSRDRSCQACSYEMFLQLYRRYKPIVNHRSDLKLLTLTWKPVRVQSAVVVRAIGDAMVKLFHRRRYARLWKGILASIECKKTKSGWFYYHVHCILSGAYIPQGVISDDWREISGFPIVDVRAIRRTPKRALRYVLKYIMKGSLMKSSRDRADFKVSMKGVRYVRSYGIFYGAEKPSGRHVYYPCPVCGSSRCWIVIEFCDVVDLFDGVPYDYG